MGLIFPFVFDLVDFCFGTEREKRGCVGIASRLSPRRWKRHHSNGDDSNAGESNGIATAVARGSWQRRLGILS